MDKEKKKKDSDYFAMNFFAESSKAGWIYDHSP